MLLYEPTSTVEWEDSTSVMATGTVTDEEVRAASMRMSAKRELEASLTSSVTTLQANHDLIQGLFAECWYGCIHGGIPYWNKDVGAFVRGPLEEFREKPHRIWRVGQRGERPEEDLPLFYPMVGYRYRSQAIVSEDASPSEQEIALLDREELTGLPGTRVPHLWLERDEQRLSTLDLLDGRFVLLAGSAGALWQKAASEAAGSSGIKLAAYRVGSDGDLLDLENGWQTKMDVSADGAMLVRPDGFVAWRTSTLPSSPQASLAQVLATILYRSIPPTRLK